MPMSDVMHFPLECPQCKTAAVQPKSLEKVLRSGELTITLSCQYCGHESRQGIAVRIATHDSGVHRLPPKPR